MLTGEKLERLAAPGLGLLARGAGARQPENGWGSLPRMETAPSLCCFTPAPRDGGSAGKSPRLG